jgi:hypothetical protein
MHRKKIPRARRFAGGGRVAVPLLAALLIQLLCSSYSIAQNITNVVAPGGSVDIQNNSGSDWYFFSAPTPAGSSMARVSSDLVSVYTWPDAANFTADPNYSIDRIYPDEYLRVFAGSLPVNTLITVQYAVGLPGNGPYYFYITVANAPYVTALNITDPSPTVAATVHWSVTFSAAISGVTAANFILTNPDGLSGATITSVTGSGSNWVVAASTGTGTGLLGCSYVGHVSESPAVPASFTGQQYTFSTYPLITVEPASSNIVAGSSYTMSIAATIRGGGGVNYQWYAGTSVNPGAATAISGATSASYTVSGLAAGSTHQYFCRAISSTNTSYTTDSTTATVSAFTPVAILTSPTSSVIASGQTKLLTVSVSGTSPNFQWYQGVAGDTSTPVGSDSSSFTTPVLSANTSYWVLVYNGLPATYNQNSATATIRVVTSLTGNGPLAVLVNEAFLPAPAFTVLDSAGVPVTNYPVALKVNASSGGGSFGGLSSTNVNSDGTGTASAVLTANGTAGAYSVTASIAPVVTDTISLVNVALLAVSTTVDEDNGTIDPTVGAGLSLREAVNYAATHPGAHTISFASALSSGGPATFIITNGSLSVAGTTTVISPGTGSVVLNGSFASRIFTIAGGANVVLNSLTLTNAHSDANDWGGAIINSGTLALTNCTLVGNVVDGSGAGGAIENEGTLTLTGCTLSGNSAGFAGAIRNDSICTLQNCTLYGNTAPDNGGAVDNVFGATLNLLYCTFSGNSAGGLGGGIDNYLSTLNLTNSIIAVNAYQDIYNWGSSTINAGRSNIVESLVNGGGTNNGSATVLSANPLLAPFGNYGGPTETMPPMPGSPAIDAGGLTSLTTDQRGSGFPRVMNFYADLGAVEALVPSIPNASFEVDTYTNGVGYASQNGGGITGWTVSPSNYIGLNPAAGSNPFADNGAIPQGANVAFIQSPGQSNTLATTISGLTPGVAYEVSFYANCRKNYGSYPNASWSLNGGPFIPFTASPGVGGSNSYYPNSGIFTASGTTAALVLANLTPGQDSTVLVDAFTITTNLFIITNHPPVLAALTQKTNHVFGFNFTNLTGASFSVLTSTNVALPPDLWSNLGRITEFPSGSGRFPFSDLATNIANRFYRVRSP